MAIPSKQIGQSAEANLLWQISKQLEQLIKVTANLNIPSTSTTTSTSTSTTSTTTTFATTTFSNQTYAVSQLDACNYNFAGSITLYSQSSELAQGVSVFTNIELTNPFTEGYAIFVGGGSGFVAGPNGVLSAPFFC